MGLKFNPFSGNFDFTGGGDAAPFAGQKDAYADLPLDSAAALNSRWLVKNNSGTWPFSTYKQAGIYIRVNTAGISRDTDYQFVGTLPSVMNDNEFLIYADGDATKNLKFDIGANVPSASTVTLTTPPASGTIAINLEYINQSLENNSSVNLAANKHYTFTKNFSGDANLLLPTTANDGDRVVVRRGALQDGGNLLVVRQGGSPFLQTIGVLSGPNTVFYAVWSGLWRQDFIPPAGFQGAPSTPTSFGISGQMAYEDPYLYVAVGTNTWRRIPVAAW
jgi:hypothetical protein